MLKNDNNGYYLKYLKYKQKYEDLKIKKQSDINNLSKIIGGGKFESKWNNGRREHYTNSCMWISIHDYLTEIMNYDITLQQLRSLGKADKEEDRNEMFDSINLIYVNGLERICQVFGININIYTKDESDKLILTDIYPLTRIEGSDSNRPTIHIFSRGLHFQLITFSEQLNINLRISSQSDRSDKSKDDKQDKQDLVYNKETKLYINIKELRATLEEATDKVNKLVSSKSKNTDLECARKRSLEDLINKTNIELALAESIITNNNEESIRFNNNKQLYVTNLKSELKLIQDTLDMLKTVGIHPTKQVYIETLNKFNFITTMINSLHQPI